MPRISTSGARSDAALLGQARSSDAAEHPGTERSDVGRPIAMGSGMLTLLLILLLVALVGGGLGHSRFGYAGWSPAGILLLVVLVMFLTGTRL